MLDARYVALILQTFLNIGTVRIAVRDWSE